MMLNQEIEDISSNVNDIKINNEEKKCIELILAIDTSTSDQIGTKVRCAVAFGCSMVCIIGNRNFNTPGSHGSHKFISIRHFYYMKDFIDFIKDRDCEVYGISSISYPSNIIPSNEYENKLININQCNFNKSVAFIIANKSNLIDETIDKILYIPLQQNDNDNYNNNIQHDINFDSKISICMHTFTNSVGYIERKRLNGIEKFQLSNVRYYRTKEDKDKYKSNNEIDNDNGDILTSLFSE